MRPGVWEKSNDRIVKSLGIQTRRKERQACIGTNDYSLHSDATRWSRSSNKPSCLLRR
ncbi:hypothetical protein ABG768_024670, partial [Culter alburnus]